MRFIEKLSPKELTLWLVGAVVLLLLATAGSWWIWNFRLDGGMVGFLADKNATFDVKKVEFVTPADMPKNFKPTPANFINAKGVVYTDQKAGCDLIAVIVNRTEKKSVKDIAINFIDPIYLASKNVKNQDQEKLNLKDIDGERNYDFGSTFIAQTTTTKGLGFKNRSMLIRYKDFGRDKVAVISYSCKDAAWEAKHANLEAIVNKFTLKTER